MTWPRGRARPDHGSVVVEFVILAVVLMAPLTYAVLAVFELQRSAFAVSSAAREGARAFVTAPSASSADRRAAAAVDLVLADHGVQGEGELRVRCDARPCLTPGATVTVTVVTQVRLPLVPSVRDEVPATVAVRARHVAHVDEYREARP